MSPRYDSYEEYQHERLKREEYRKEYEKRESERVRQRERQRQKAIVSVMQIPSVLKEICFSFVDYVKKSETSFSTTFSPSNETNKCTR